MLFDRSLDGIGEAELQDLVTNTVAEDRQLEYKLALPTNQRVDRIEFLKDTSALANTAGGDLVYGIQEGQNGNHTVAVFIDGVAAADADATKLRLENMMRDGLKPRIIGTRIRAVPLANGNTIFVIRMPQSWNAPHVVDYDGH